jgi:hypothetical protein
MSAVIHQMVLRKRAASMQAEAATLERDAIIAGAKGDPGIVWRGAWDKATDYAAGDAVAYLGASYIAVAASIGERPKKAGGFWDVLAERGKDGKAGADGKAGLIAIGGGGGTDLDALPLTTGFVPQEIALKHNGQWVRVTWSEFVSMLGAPIPANTATVNGEAITVNGEFITVNPGA